MNFLNKESKSDLKKCCFFFFFLLLILIFLFFFFWFVCYLVSLFRDARGEGGTRESEFVLQCIQIYKKKKKSFFFFFFLEGGWEKGGGELE